MSDLYLRELMRISVAQICQTIGYHAIQTTQVDLLLDILYKFLHEFSRAMRGQVEHYNRTEVHLNDVQLSLSNLNINIPELLDYINNVEPVPCGVEISKLPTRKNASLNFLKPGSKEVLSRPVHIYEHLPPMLPPDSCKGSPMNYTEYKTSLSKSIIIFQSLNPPLKTDLHVTGCENPPTTNRAKRGFEAKEGILSSELTPICIKTGINLSQVIDDEGRPTREICSVVMTTGGFISPAIEGKIPDSVIPKYFGKILGLDSPGAPTPHSIPLTELTKEDKMHISNLSGGVDYSDIANTSLQQSTLHTNVGRQKVTEDALKNNLVSAPKDTILKQNAMGFDLLNASKKTVLSQQKPAVVSKLPNRVKKKITYNSQTPLISKVLFQDIRNPRNDFFRIGPSEKTRRKIKKNEKKKIVCSATDSALSPDFCSAVFQRLKMEKIHKKQATNEKKLLWKQNCTTEFKNQDFSVNMLNPHEIKLPLASVIKSELKDDESYIERDVLSRPLSQGMAPIYLPKFDPTEISSSISHSNLKDNGFNIINSKRYPVNDTKIYIAQNTKEIPEIKLSAELDRNKLNIFKKISKQKPQKGLPPNRNMASPIYKGDAHINLPCGTTITATPTTLNPLKCSAGANLVSSENTKTSCIVSNNCQIGNAMAPEVKISDVNFSGAIPLMCSNIQSSQHAEITKRKKRGRKPGIKNLPRSPVETSNNLSEVTLLKKTRKVKSLKHTYSLPLVTLKNTNSIATESKASNEGKDVLSKSEIKEDMITSNFLTQVKSNRKERGKGKARRLPMTLCMSEEHVEKLDVGVPTKEEVHSINKKLMRMDTVLQPLGLLNETLSQTDGRAETVPMNLLPKVKSLSDKKHPAPTQSTVQQSTPITLMPPNVLMPSTGLGGLQNLLKFCPFPPSPGLIPPTGPNFLFPRLPANFHLPISNFKQQYNAGKDIDQDSSTKGAQQDSVFYQLKERNYCNVPPFVPESMKLAPFETNVHTAKSTTRDCLTTLSAVEMAKHDVPLNEYEAQNQIEIVSIKSPKRTAQNPNPSVASAYQSSSPNKSLKPFADSSNINKNDPIELSDESVDYSPMIANTYSTHNLKELDQAQIGAAAASLHNKKEMFNSPDDSKKGNHEFALKDKKKIKKSDKVLRNGKSLIQAQRADLPQIDMIGTEKVGVSKLAGGADLIPLTSTGSAYSSKTIPSTSLTATTSASFGLPDKDCPITSTFSNSLLSANLKSCGVFSISTTIPRKKKEHKKIKKLKDIKTKRKKEKKSRNKERIDCSENVYINDKQQIMKLRDAFRADADHHLNRDLKKIKRGKKKKDKQIRTHTTQQADTYPGIDSPGINSEEKSASASSLPSVPCIVSSSAKSCVPKLTLKIGSGQSPLMLDDIMHKNSSILSGNITNEPDKKRDPSPELARILPLVTRPLKQKLIIAGNSVKPELTSKNFVSSTHSASSTKNTLNESNTNAINLPNTPSVTSAVPPPSPWSSGGTISASSVLLPQQLLQSTTTQEQLELNATEIAVAARSSSSAARQSPVPIVSESSRPSSYIDSEGNRVWICPACGKVDDGSPMIGCDGCDAWYHWICVGICIAPKDNEDWFCRVCITRKKGMHASDKKRRRHKKK